MLMMFCGKNKKGEMKCNAKELQQVFVQESRSNPDPRPIASLKIPRRSKTGHGTFHLDLRDFSLRSGPRQLRDDGASESAQLAPNWHKAETASTSEDTKQCITSACVAPSVFPVLKNVSGQDPIVFSKIQK